MPENLILFLFLGLIFGVIGGILFTLLAKHLKGSIKISLPKRAYKYGESIVWSFSLHAKKQIEGEMLSVFVVGYKRDTSYGKDGKKHTRRVEFARFAQHIESATVYEQWLRKDYDINIQIPSFENVYGQNPDIDLWDSTLGKLASFALKNSRRMQLTWQVHVDLEAKGVDIHGKKDIFITQ